MQENETNEDDVIFAINELSSELMAKNHSYLAFKFFKLLEWPLITQFKINDVLKNLSTDLAQDLLSKTLLESKPDLPFALSVLGGQDRTKKVLKMLMQFSASVNSNIKLANMARLGARYCSMLSLIHI